MSGIAVVMLISDRPSWLDDVGSQLGAEGFEVLYGAPGRLALSAVAQADVGVVTAVPASLGIAACTEFRSWSPVPVLALGRDREDEAVIESILAAGADQISALSVSIRVLNARILVLLRWAPHDQEASRAVEVLYLDPVESSAGRGDVRVALTAPEFGVLQALLHRPGRVVSRAHLQRVLTSTPAAPTLDAVVRGLRSKLERVESDRRIVSIRGVGLRYEFERGVG